MAGGPRFGEPAVWRWTAGRLTRRERLRADASLALARSADSWVHLGGTYLALTFLEGTADLPWSPWATACLALTRLAAS